MPSTSDPSPSNPFVLTKETPLTVLRFYLFGAPRLERDGQAIKIDTWKALALLAYLALNDQEHSREALATTFWPDQGAAQARSSLRRALWTLRQTVDQDALPGDKQTIRFHAPAGMIVDVRQFQTLVTTVSQPANSAQMDKLRSAVALYRADFLAGFTLPDCPTFDEWQFFTADRLRRSFSDVLQRLIEWETSQQDYLAAGETARRWLSLDPLHEAAHRCLMQLYSWSGQHAAALRQYEECKRLVEEELAAPLDAATIQVYTAIRSHRLALPNQPVTTTVQTTFGAPLPSPTRHNLPQLLTPLLGRDLELTELDLLMNRRERLITITGAGGMGKTSLALAVADRQRAASRFRDGVFLVSLVAVDSVEAILLALVNVLELPAAAGQRSASTFKRQLLDFLRPRHLLLLFDNFEQVLAGRDLLVEILTSAPQVHLLVTSRERLHLHDEQLYPISGLECPTTKDDAAPALALFLRAAQRVDPHFQPAADDLLHLMRICKLVAGMPLALELAAGWVKLLAPSAIADAIQANLDLLETTLHDTPPRHRSVRAAFDTTWHLLANDERRIFAQLTLFRGGFTETAAEQIAGATRKHLRILADKSLIEYRRAVDRFDIHELLRQYGAEKLSATALHQATQANHLHYFLQLVERAEPHLRSSERAAWLRSLVHEHYNLRLAFDWACITGLTTPALRLAAAVLYYWVDHGDWAEGAHCLANALALRKTESTATAEARPLAKVLYGAGLFAWYQSDYGRAKIYADESLELCQQLVDRLGSAQARHLLGLTARAQRNFPEATQHFIIGLDLARQYADKRLMASILNDMGAIAWRQNDFVKANELFLESLTYYQCVQDAHGIALNLYDLGLVACWQGEVELARSLGERSLVAFQQLADPFYTAQVHSLLALVAMHQNELDKAQAFFTEALASYQRLNAQRSIAITLLRLGHVRCRQGNLELASQLVGEATPMLRRIGDPLNLVHALEAWFYLAVDQSKFVAAARLCGAIDTWRERLGTPRPPVDTPEYDHKVVTIHTALGPASFTSERAAGQNISLDQAFIYIEIQPRQAPS